MQLRKQQEAQLKLKQEEEMKNEKKVVGKLGVNVLKGKGIKNVDSMPFSGCSDPYVEIGLTRGSKEKLVTKIVDDCLNPIWDMVGKEINVLLGEKLVESEFMCLRLMDKNTGLPDTFIGSAAIEFNKCFVAPGKWAVN